MVTLLYSFDTEKSIYFELILFVTEGFLFTCGTAVYLSAIAKSSHTKTRLIYILFLSLNNKH